MILAENRYSTCELRKRPRKLRRTHPLRLNFRRMQRILNPDRITIVIRYNKHQPRAARKGNH